MRNHRKQRPPQPGSHSQELCSGAGLTSCYVSIQPDLHSLEEFEVTGPWHLGSSAASSQAVPLKHLCLNPLVLNKEAVEMDLQLFLTCRNGLGGCRLLQREGVSEHWAATLPLSFSLVYNFISSLNDVFLKAVKEIK